MGGNKTDSAAIGAGFVARGAALAKEEFSKLSWLHVFGFAICQSWTVLCFALPDPVTYADPFLDLRWVSASATCVLLALFCFAHRRVPLCVGRNAVVFAIAAVASVSSALGPVSVLFPESSALLLAIAAAGLGVGFAFLPIVWLSVFWAARENAGLIASLVLAAVLTYPLANTVIAGTQGTWVIVAACSFLPMLSALMLPRKEAVEEACACGAVPAEKRGFRELEPSERDVLVRFCLCLFFVVAIIELCRNVLLGGAQATFFAGAANLVGILLRCFFGVLLVIVFARRSMDAVSRIYRWSFLLVLAVVLAIPFIMEGNWAAHVVLDMGAFCFEAVMMMVLLEMVSALAIEAVLLFALTRAVWSAAVVAGIAMSGCGYGADSSFVLFGVAVMGVACAFMFVFVFTDAHCTRVLAKSCERAHATPFKDQCRLAALGAGLSGREAEVMAMVAKGRSSQRVADDLGVSLSTVNSHIYHIYQKMGVHSRQEMLDRIESYAAEATAPDGLGKR
ncbi:MAG: helix-turn-helix transcriptional regulator [Slackia sp.]|nr:helix-turn-helix transcriptional regulator [Slackia sp.]